MTVINNNVQYAPTPEVVPVCCHPGILIVHDVLVSIFMFSGNGLEVL